MMVICVDSQLIKQTFGCFSSRTSARSSRRLTLLLDFLGWLESGLTIRSTITVGIKDFVGAFNDRRLLVHDFIFVIT